jgi:hypothetical protein
MTPNHATKLLQLINLNGNQGLVAWLKRITRKGSLGWSIVLLGGGTAIGQGLSVLATPLLTRLFTPSDFGVMGAFVSIVPYQSDRGSDRQFLFQERDVANAFGTFPYRPVDDLPHRFCQGGIQMTWAGYEKLGCSHMWIMPFAVAGEIVQVFNCWAIREKAFVEMAGMGWPRPHHHRRCWGSDRSVLSDLCWRRQSVGA